MKKIGIPLVLAAMAVVAGSPERASSQQNSASDVSGPSTTGSTPAGGVYTPSPGTIAVEASPAIAAAISTATSTVTAQLSAGSLVSTTGVAIPPAVQAAVLGVLTGAAPASTMAAALGGGGGAAALADALVGLASSPSPGQLAAAVGHYNALVLAADPGFLANPPPAFLAVHAVLSQLLGAAQLAN